MPNSIVGDNFSVVDTCSGGKRLATLRDMVERVQHEGLGLGHLFFVFPWTAVKGGVKKASNRALTMA